jgi:hypothetical protein
MGKVFCPSICPPLQRGERLFVYKEREMEKRFVIVKSSVRDKRCRKNNPEPNKVEDKGNKEIRDKEKKEKRL